MGRCLAEIFKASRILREGIAHIKVFDAVLVVGVQSGPSGRAVTARTVFKFHSPKYN